ncbi:MAG: hypothetical protein ACI9C1_003426 [Candidatus Aldehydirespiratoraceae bacterium]
MSARVQLRPGQLLDARAPTSGGGGNLGGGVLSSVIVSVLVLVAGVNLVGRRPPWALQPATSVGVTRSWVRPHHRDMMFAVEMDQDDDDSIIMDSLRVLGLVRQRVEKPVVGRRAYVRLWERVRALIVLTAIIVTIGVVLAASIGIVFLAAGFLLEQAIS